MSNRIDSAGEQQDAPPFWRNVRVRSWIFQAVILFIVLSIVSYLITMYQTNTQASQIKTNFDFLKQPAGITLQESRLQISDQVREGYEVGFLNTLRLVIPGLFLTTVLGILIGIGRLSKNFLVRNAATIYVEAVRNVPLLLFILFIKFAVFQSFLPQISEIRDKSVSEFWSPFGLFVISRRGVSFPWFEGSGKILFVLLAAGVAVWWALGRWRTAVADKTGAPARTGMWGSFGLLSVLIIGWLAFGFSFTTPEVAEASVGEVTVGGIAALSSYMTVLAALVIYTASHIAEIVRGSIQSVHRGQPEAAQALGLSGFQRMWHVVLPQALRSAVPPLGNQYLNLMKNSSLAAAAGYGDITQFTQLTVGTRSPAVPAFAVALALYLFLSLIISLCVNIYNRRMALVTR